ncbi:hypothetical protein ACM1ZW_20770 [Pseudomonas sp. NFX71]|uniref:hypothetical protein n=1 Tax=Pseudomonas sp. NFX71 TaxID=3399121 RepID=UPI003A865B25
MSDDKIIELEQRITRLESSINVILTAALTKPVDQEASNEIQCVEVSKNGILLALDDVEAKSLVDNLVLRIDSWEHRWYTDVFNTSTTWFNGTVHVIDETNGVIQQWNLIESASTNECCIPLANTQYFKTFPNATHANFGWGKRDARSMEVSAWIKFYANWGWVAWRVKTEGCAGCAPL